ncbi:pyrroline-5-carboxylate reductase [Nocardioides sp. L-11A]|uniref:pyrroline-5-carboxylate reductase n=1 Tax=Nocardioides sp. L-11A TaxID=3043848 RepID=UPI002499E5FE|nr:pyrroline-5-carboxylate reductase [Nocardioides sp. L-11A]
MGTTIAFLGCGAMNEAILAGLLDSGVPADQVVATVRTVERAARLADRYGVRVAATADDAAAGSAPTSNARAAAEAAVVVLGVKPAQVPALAAEIAAGLAPDTVVVSVAGAVPLASIERVLRPGQPVVRAMPNTPTRVGHGVTALAPGAHASAEHLRRAHALFDTVGLVVEVAEDRLDAVGAVSGSGPAYVFYLTEALAEAGARLGLPAELARLLAARTVAGAGRMLDGDSADPADLRRAVTSPHGSTERAIATFEQRDLRAIVAAGAAAAAARSREIARELE